MEFVNYYELLQLPQTASADEIGDAIRKQRKRYRQLAGAPDLQRRSMAEKMMQQLADAERILKDPQARHQYDSSFAENVAAAEHRETSHGPSDDSVASFMQDASDYYEQGDFENALRAALEAYRLDPKDSLITAFCADCEMELQEYKDANFHINQALRVDPDNARYWGLLGEIQDSMQEWDKAEQSFDKAATLQPNEPYWAGRVVWARLDLHHYQEALDLVYALRAKYPQNKYIANTFAGATADYIANVVASHEGAHFEFTNMNQVKAARDMLVQVDMQQCQENVPLVNMLAEIRDKAANAERRRFDASKGLGFYVKWLLLLFVVMIVLGCIGNGVGWVIFLFASIVFIVWYAMNYVFPVGWRYVQHHSTQAFCKTGLQ